MIRVGVDDLKTLPKAKEAVQQLLDEREAFEKTTTNEKNALKKKIEILEQTIAKNNGGVVKTASVTGVSSQFISVAGR